VRKSAIRKRIPLALDKPEAARLRGRVAPLAAARS
jgi:hypothetical protein